MCDDHASYLQLQVYIQACNDVTTRSLSYCIVFYIAARYKTGPEFILHTASHGTIFFALIYTGIFPKNCVCNAVQVIYHIAYTLGTFLHFLVKTDSEVFKQTDARIFAPILPILGISAVRMTDIRTRHPKKTRKWTDGPGSI